MPEFFQTRMGQKFYEHDVPKLTQTLENIETQLKHANQLKADELTLKEKELRLKEKELELKQRELDKA